MDLLSWFHHDRNYVGTPSLSSLAYRTRTNQKWLKMEEEEEKDNEESENKSEEESEEKSEAELEELQEVEEGEHEDEEDGGQDEMGARMWMRMMMMMRRGEATSLRGRG